VSVLDYVDFFAASQHGRC